MVSGRTWDKRRQEGDGRQEKKEGGVGGVLKELEAGEIGGSCATICKTLQLKNG